MTGERQIERFIRAHRDGTDLPRDRFENGPGAKVRCVLCHAAGYGSTVVGNWTTFDGRAQRWDRWLNRWQIAHLMDHPWPCSCGRTFIRFVDLWRHIGADRPTGWGRQDEHRYALECEVVS